MTFTHTRLPLLPLGAALVLALTACGGAESGSPEPGADSADTTEEAADTPAPDTSDLHRGPIPDAAPDMDEADLPPEPEGSAPLSERIAWEALERVSSFANTTDPDAASTCPDIAGEEGESATCTVTFLGEEFEYTIDVESGGVLISYTPTLHEGPVVREVVEDTLRVQTESEQVACDMEEVVSVAPDSEGVARCRALNEDLGEVLEYDLNVGGVGTLSFPQV
ncbi:hypothetical protein [Nocardiopsis sp. FIRDI 009]|uniref:hypothetical protein n=1 Tax=Nocardiopsis sp. FIRDI 009 TaxID=714197 RepID=UPI000E227333|nr:hypothetical protein [Nocardiopsis sp. FIRDI 009]